VTTSETARLVRAEIEAIVAGLPLHELVVLLEHGRRLCERSEEARFEEGRDACRAA
jgi:hypothetical protein